MASPLVSVVVTCYDLGRYLDDAVDSVLAQTAGAAEILITDDGGRDPDTTALLDRYDRPRTRVIRLPHLGLARARNALIAEARGAFLCALDADDRLHPRFFEKALAEFDRRPGLTFVSSWLTMFGIEDGVWRHRRCDLPTLLAECTVHTAAVVRRQAVVAAGGYDAAMPHQGYDDWDLWITLVERGGVGTILQEPLFYYRRRERSMSLAYVDPNVHLALVTYVVDKHAASFSRHWTDVMLKRESDAAAVTTAGWSCTRRRLELAPMASALAAELARMSASIPEPPALRDAVPRPEPWAMDAAKRTARQALRMARDHDQLASRWPQVLLEMERTDAASRAAARGACADADLLARYVDEGRVEVRRLHDVRRAAGLPTVELGDVRRTTPMSDVWGLDRGQPIDRYYIDAFLEQHAADVRGVVLEVKDSSYARAFGGDRVTGIEVVDIDQANEQATIVGDLTVSRTLHAEHFDCVILTQTLNVIYHAAAALDTCWRALKPGGVLLCTVSALNRISCEPGGADDDQWRFTERALGALVAQVAPAATVELYSWGNVLSCTAFLYGLATHEVSRAQLDATDRGFPLVVAARVSKPLMAAPLVRAGPEVAASEDADGPQSPPAARCEPSHHRPVAWESDFMDLQVTLAAVLRDNRRLERQLVEHLEPLATRLSRELRRLQAKARANRGGD